MAMPTTRRGRFEFYRERQQRRMKKVRNRYGTNVGQFGGPGGKPSSREFDLSSFTPQMPRTYPRHQVLTPGLGQIAVFWRVRPWWGVFGVPEWEPVLGGLFPPHYHAEHAFLHYQRRRLKSIPRLKHLPVKPYRHTLAEVAAGSHYPSTREFYPSGRPNPWYVP